MRLLTLALEKYGMFTGRTVSFAPDARVHVVFGPNESGKTTALSAVTDLLYGIEERRGADDRRRFNFQHANSDVRIGAEIVGRDGRQFAFRRRYGRRNTVVDANDKPLPDDTLEPWLVGVSRSVFEHTFGLSQQGLRAGGEAMLQADGEIGRSLFAAASGLTGLANLGRGLQEEAELQFKPSSRGSTKFDKLRREYEDARKAVRDRMVTFQAWRDLSETIANLDSRISDSRTRREEIGKERSRLSRLRRVAPILAAIDRLESELAAFAGLPELPEGFDARIRRHLDDMAGVERDRTQQQQALSNADGRLARLAVQPELAAAGPQIDSLVERLQVLRDCVRDLPKRTAEYEDASAQLDEYARRLGLADADALLAIEPSDAMRARARKLLSDFAILASTDIDLQRRREMAEAAVAAAESVRNADANARDPEPLRRRLAALRPDAEAVANRAQLSASLERRRVALAQRASRLTPPVALDRLVGLALPTTEEVRGFVSEAAELDTTAGNLTFRRRELTQQIARERQAWAQLDKSTASLTADAIASIRAERDRLWSTARQFVLPGEAPPLDSIARTHLARDVDSSVAEADRLADRRDAESQRIALYDEIVRRLDDAHVAMQALENEEATLAERRASQDKKWRALWRSSSVTPATPAEMATWLAAVASLSAEEAALGADVANLDSMSQREAALTPVVEALAAELSIQAQGLPLSAAIREIEAAVGTVAQNWQSLRDAARDLDKARQVLTELATTEDGHATQMEAWRTAWSDLMPALGLRPDASVEEAEAALAVWSDVPATRTRRATASRRSGQMTQTLDDSRAELDSVRQRILPDLTATELIPAITTLRDWVKQAREAETAARQITEERSRIAERLDKTDRRRAELSAEQNSLVAQCGLPNADGLSITADRIAARERCRSDLAQHLHDLTAQGDGLSESELRTECADVPIDDLAARAEVIEQDDRTLVDELAKVQADLVVSQQKRTELEAGRGAERAAQDEAVAAAGLVALARDYARIEAACLLVTLAIEHHRARYQDPLIARASEIFAALTGKSFAGLALDYSGADTLTLVAARAGRRRVPISGLSEGTRDQLYLALRLAALGEFAARAAAAFRMRRSPGQF